jgi:hypothetical protein
MCNDAFYFSTSDIRCDLIAKGHGNVYCMKAPHMLQPFQKPFTCITFQVIMSLWLLYYAFHVILTVHRDCFANCLIVVTEMRCVLMSVDAKFLIGFYLPILLLLFILTANGFLRGYTGTTIISHKTTHTINTLHSTKYFQTCVNGGLAQ